MDDCRSNSSAVIHDRYAVDLLGPAQSLEARADLTNFIVEAQENEVQQGKMEYRYGSHFGSDDEFCTRKLRIRN